MLFLNQLQAKRKIYNFLETILFKSSISSSRKCTIMLVERKRRYKFWGNNYSNLKNMKKNISQK